MEDAWVASGAWAASELGHVIAEVADAEDPGLFPVVAAVLIALPMVGVLAFFFWVKIRDRDDPSGPVLKPGREEPDEDETT